MLVTITVKGNTGKEVLIYRQDLYEDQVNKLNELANDLAEENEDNL